MRQITTVLLALLVSVIALVHATPVEFDFSLAGPFSARTGHTLVSWHGSELLLMGGDDGIVGVPNVRNDIYRSRDGGKSWELLVDHAPWAARELHVAIATPSAIYVIAGGSAKYAFPDVWRSVDGGRTWELRSRGTAPFGIRTYASGCALGEQLFLIGGSDGSQALADVWTSLDGGASWTKIAENQFRPRLGHSAVCLEDGAIVVIGGMLNSASSGILSDEVFRSDDKGLSWTQISGQGITDPDAHFAARAQHAAVSMAGSLVLVGGLTYGPQAYSDMWESRDGGRSWALLGESSVFEKEFAPRYGHQIACLSTGHAVLVGGLAGQGFPLADVHQFSLAPINAKTNARSYVMHGKRRVHIMDAEIGYLFFPDLTISPAWSPTVSDYVVTSPNPVPSVLTNQQVRIVHSGNFQRYTLSFLTNNVWVSSNIIWEATGTGQFPSPLFDLSAATGITAVRVLVFDLFRTKEYTIVIRGGVITTVPPILACPVDAVQWSVQDANLCDTSCTFKLWTYNYCYRTSTGQTVPLECCNDTPKPNPVVPCTLNTCVPTSTIPPSTPATTVIGPTTMPGTAPAVMPAASGPRPYSYAAVPVDVCEGVCSVPNPACTGPCGGGYQRFTSQCVDVRGQPVDNAFCIAAQVAPLTFNALYKPCTITTQCTLNEIPEVNGAAQCSSIVLSVGSLAPNFDPSTLVYGVNADTFSSITIRAVALGGESFDILVQNQHLSSKANGAESAPITIADNARTKVTVRCFSALNWRDYYIYVYRGSSFVTYSWTQVPTGICSRSCSVLDDGTVVPATMNVSAYCVNNLGVKVDDSLCSGTKPSYASTSCNAGLICSQNTYLSNLAVLNFNSDITFNRDTQQYTIRNAPCGRDKYTQITPTLDDPKASITYWKTGGFFPVPVTPIASTATSAGITLENRLNIIQIQVRAQDAIAQRTYFLYIDFSGCPDPITTTSTPAGGSTQSSTSTQSTVSTSTVSTSTTATTTRTTTTLAPTCTAINTLGSLSTSLGTGSLSPAFDPNVLTYTVHVDSTAAGKVMTIFASTSDGRAFIEARRSPNPYTNFTGSQNYLLSTGANYIELRVNPCDKSGYVRHYMITVIVGALIAGDPQITGLQGQDFQVHGTPDEIFNMVSHPDYQVNSRFIFLGKGSARCLDNYTACWTHPGTYIDVLGFHFRTHKIRVNAGKYEEGLRLFIDEKEVIPSKDVYQLGNGMSVSFKRRREVFVRTSLFVFSAVNSDRFLNQKMELLDDSLMRAGSVKAKSGNAVIYPNFPLHGILGQTWKNIVYHHGTGPQIEGHVDDYRVEDQDIYGDQFYFNQFKN